MMEQHARRQQLDLLLLAARDLARPRFDPATRTEIVNLLKVLLERVRRRRGRQTGGGR